MNHEGLRREVEATRARYHLGTDHGQVEDLVACFAEDGVLEIPRGALRGREAIRAALSRMGSGGVSVRHHLTTCDVRATDEDHASGWCYFLVLSSIGLDHAGRYLDEYVRVGDRWLIAHRRIVVEWASDHSMVRATVTAPA